MKSFEEKMFHQCLGLGPSFQAPLQNVQGSGGDNNFFAPPGINHKKASSTKSGFIIHFCIQNKSSSVKCVDKGIK